ncbi:hypothetical protein Tco_1094779 [Tanacetum coccineum]|uniref:Tf2-1-like SH3-like domain-containing protein n=1 Tax=Tanacetum coccineum TaxID=301880 RepID=A0ABQ5IGH0_9ASTR
MRKQRWLELLSDLDYAIRYHPGKANVVEDALSRKERIKPLRVRALVMTIGLSLLVQILDALAEARKEEETVAYRLELPEQLSRVHNTFHMSNLKKCLPDESLVITLDEIHIDDKLHFIEEPVEIIDREVKRLKQSRIPFVKVRWNSKRGPEHEYAVSSMMDMTYWYSEQYSSDFFV